MSNLEDSISNKETYSTLTYKKLKEVFNDLAKGDEKQPRREVVMYTGLYGMYNFNFCMGEIGIPNSYKHHGTIKNKESYQYITLGHTSSNIKCKIRMYRKVSKIEVYFGTVLLFSSNHFNSVYKELKKRKINIIVYNKFKRVFENE